MNLTPLLDGKLHEKNFRFQSYVKYALSFEPNRFTTEIQLRFRTREEHGELFRVSDQHNREYGILEISESKLRFRSGNQLNFSVFFP